MVDVLPALNAVLSLHVTLIDSDPASEAQRWNTEEQTDTISANLNAAAVARDAALAVTSEGGTARKAAARVTLEIHADVLGNLLGAFVAVWAMVVDRHSLSFWCNFGCCIRRTNHLHDTWGHTDC